VLCRIIRWKVSGAIDSGKPMSDAVKRHLLRCASCREFAGLAEETGRRLTRDAGVLMGSIDQALAGRVKASLRDQVEAPASAPELSRRRKPRRRPGSSFRLKPILAAAAALVVVGASVLWVVRSRPQPMPELTPPFQIEEPGAYLVAAAKTVNSPYEKEMWLWKEALDGAAKRLEDCFNIGLGKTK
jgi:hypothetical protein